MKKLIISLITLVFMASCTVIPHHIVVTNNEINMRATKHININKNLIFARLSLKNIKTEAKKGLIESKLKYEYSVLGGVVVENEGTVLVNSSLEVKNNKLYLKDPRVLKITAANGLEENEKIANVITEILLNSLTYKELYDFKNDYYVKDIRIINNLIILVTE